MGTAAGVQRTLQKNMWPYDVYFTSQVRLLNGSSATSNDSRLELKRRPVNYNYVTQFTPAVYLLHLLPRPREPYQTPANAALPHPIHMQLVGEVFHSQPRILLHSYTPRGVCNGLEVTVGFETTTVADRYPAKVELNAFIRRKLTKAVQRRLQGGAYLPTLHSGVEGNPYLLPRFYHRRWQ